MNEKLKTYLDEQFATVRADIAVIREELAENTVLLAEHSEILKETKSKVNATFHLVGEYDTRRIEL